MIDRATFDQLVDEALESLPDEIAAWLDNVAIVVGEWPTPQQLDQAGLRPGQMLFGLYVGVPKTHRGFTYGESVPDKIVIFHSRNNTRNYVRNCGDTINTMPSGTTQQR